MAEPKIFPGFGATRADLERGHMVVDDYCPASTELANYKQRATVDKHDPVPDELFWPGDDDADFRNRGRRAKGFLTRPPFPTER